MIQLFLGLRGIFVAMAIDDIDVLARVSVVQAEVVILAKP